MIFAPELYARAASFLESCRQRRLLLTTAESCTGGLFSALITEIPGSSDVFTHGFITYANAAKQEMIGVSARDLERHGAVSKTVAVAMAEGALKTAKASLSIAITGIAGPGGATAGKPVGLVHLASARTGFSTVHVAQQFSGDRAAIRLQAVSATLDLLQQQLAR